MCGADVGRSEDHLYDEVIDYPFRTKVLLDALERPTDDHWNQRPKLFGANPGVAGGSDAKTPPFINAKVSDVMTRRPVTCKVDDPLEQCELKMQHHQLRRIPVLDKQGALMGIVSQADVLIHHNVEHGHSLLRAISRPSNPLEDDDLDD
jgi:hypothetical protein